MASNNTDAGSGLLDAAPMHWRQWVVVCLCIALNALDGFDVLAISFAAPGIAAEWGIDRAMLGIVLSMELIGMATGSVLIGNLADRIGRRPTILACLVVMAAGMLLSALARDVAFLSATRLATGLGIGGMLSSTSAMVAEYSNARRRSLNVVLNIAGYSSGAILGGLVAAALLEGSGDWRSVFLFGGVATLAVLPLAWFLLPESIDSLLARRPADALERVNRTLARLGQPLLAALPAPLAGGSQRSLLSLFTGGYARVTILLTIAYFTQIMLFYFVQKWVPKIVVDMGHDAASAGRVLVAANVGSLASAVLIGLASQKLRLRPLVVGAMLCSFLAIGLFGSGLTDLFWLSLVVALAAFFINAGVVGMYPILATTFPAHLRASGIGFVIGVGRGGSAIGPVLAGALFAGGSGLLPVSLVMGAGGLVAAAMLLLLPRRE
ncbi:MFS transporter [Niveispirillum fermenti]|uniref:MFS transporter n=1 Tax=Niveispirillum fermenti TaxID=1233113 RepID=UPI003A8BF445